MEKKTIITSSWEASGKNFNLKADRIGNDKSVSIRISTSIRRASQYNTTLDAELSPEEILQLGHALIEIAADLKLKS